MYCTYSKKNFVAAYGEGLAFALLITTPIVLFSFIVDYWNMGVFLIICWILIAIDWAITWDDDKVNAKYHYFDLNKWKMEKEFSIVKWAIIFNFFIKVYVCKSNWIGRTTFYSLK